MMKDKALFKYYMYYTIMPTSINLGVRFNVLRLEVPEKTCLLLDKAYENLAEALECKKHLLKSYARCIISHRDDLQSCCCKFKMVYKYFSGIKKGQELSKEEIEAHLAFVNSIDSALS
ncbi:hypothetical protein [Campylobacter sp. MIT 97-5078]|uniref:hypothetical protein n=1 Tax=Campylobacter sp. MIT 97-5078 TaxID=1548153 RepID=UPI0005139355|nr:hypothetical protein [Campylobacter sp. MIT 97-5078]KGI55448.1 hypothetical protein LR59_12035 [Campylobacter sp. MIT 97-5078]KGI57357.1 hypothetical protein LR59_01105 [Campylobacter sp. MIT 97-5078]TQR27445.1 hypothetical protein DMB91_04095 [Campylobacter sp. MIT 97-5078]